VSAARSRGRRAILALAAALGLVLPAGGATGAAAAGPPRGGEIITGPPPTTLLEVSNFRFCRNAPCDPDEQGYVRAPSGPVPGGDNPAARVRILPGGRVTWTYADEACDSLVRAPLDCPGHQVVLEDGTAAGTAVGALPARSGPVSIEWYVPRDARPGTLLRYFCRVANHAQLGLTGVLEVVSPVRG
jgi:hypothetical protein